MAMSVYLGIQICNFGTGCPLRKTGSGLRRMRIENDKTLHTS